MKKEIPSLGFCSWVVYLIHVFLEGKGIKSRYLVLKFLEDGDVKIHFLLKVFFEEKFYYVDIVRKTLYLTSKYDSLFKRKNNLSKFEFLSLIEFEDNEKFPEDFFGLLDKKDLGDWDFNKLVENLYEGYRKVKRKEMKVDISFVVDV